jgi:hypothetical protein
MGSNWWTRDGVIDTLDERIIHEVRTGTGKIKAWADDPFNSDPTEGVEWRAINSQPMSTRPANFDRDFDGMPDTWEVLHKLNPLSSSNNGDFDNDGYTNLEEYLNDIAAWPAPRPIVWNGGDGRYAIQANWDINWQPSRYDVVQVNGGTATIDAVGQQAGGLQIAAGATVKIAPGVDIVQRVGAVASNGRFDLTDNAVIVDYDPAATSPLVLIAGQKWRRVEWQRHHDFSGRRVTRLGLRRSRRASGSRPRRNGHVSRPAGRRQLDPHPIHADRRCEFGSGRQHQRLQHAGRQLQPSRQALVGRQFQLRRRRIDRRLRGLGGEFQSIDGGEPPGSSSGTDGIACSVGNDLLRLKENTLALIKLDVARRRW